MSHSQVFTLTVIHWMTISRRDLQLIPRHFAGWWGGLGFMLCYEKTSTALCTSGCQWHDARPLEYTAK